MPKIYLGELTLDPFLLRALEEAGFEAREGRPPPDPGREDLALVSASAGITSTLRHELNNPLTAVLGFTQLLLRAEDLDAAARVKVQKIHEHASRVRDLIRKPTDLDG